MYKLYFKRVFDIFLSMFLLIVFLPLTIIILIFQVFIYNTKVLFIQKRLGMYGEVFKIIKFKTLNDNKNIHGQLKSDEERITKFGGILRKYSMDELPQLINVLKGDMSFIGPRPLLPEYLNLYNNFQKRRHEVKPGITGWAQVNGRNAISWQKKFEYDVWYVDNISFWLDLKILFLTIKKVFKSEGISSSTSLTMEKFTGN